MNRNVKWFLFARRDMGILLYSLLFPGYTKKRLSSFIPNVGFDHIKANKNGEIFFEKNEWDESGKKFLELVLEKPKLSLKLLNLSFKLGNNFLNFARKISKRDWQKATNEQIISALNDLKLRCYQWAFWMTFPQTVDKFLENYLREKIIPKIKNINLSQNEILGIIITSKKRIYADQAQNDLYKIAKDIEDKKYRISSLKVKEKIKDYLKKYAWIEARWWKGEGTTEKEVIAQLKRIIPQIETLLKEEKEKERKKKKLFNLLVKGLTKKEKELIRLTQGIVYLRTYRTDIFNWGGFLVGGLLKEVAHRLDISYDDLHFFRIDEIIGFLLKGKRKLVLEELQERKEKDWTYFTIHGKEKILYKSAKVRVKKEIEEIKGKVGYSGKVRGKIKIVLNKNQFLKVKKGDILVTSMTSPDFIPVLKKVSAIITDEGGITCHAAIIAREMKIPCIIGTKIATKVLKDGDLVEVDANKGIIKVIK